MLCVPVRVPMDKRPDVLSGLVVTYGRKEIDCISGLGFRRFRV